MKAFQKSVHLLFLVVILLTGFDLQAQAPTYACIAKNDTLQSQTVYQFDVYIYRTGATDLYLNNYQLSFQINNSAAILNGGTLTGSYVPGSSDLPAPWTLGGVNIFATGGQMQVRLDGVAANTSGTLIPVSGLRIGSFQIINSVPFGQSNMNMCWYNAIPAATIIMAVVPPAASGTTEAITDMASHFCSFTDPILNLPVTAYNITGGGTDCQGLQGAEVGLSGSQDGVLYQLQENGLSTGPDIPGTDGAISFGGQSAGVYTSTAYRSATYLTNTMNGSVTVTEGTAPTPAGTITGSAAVCEGASGVAYSVASIANATSYAWALPPDVTIASGAGTNSITVDFGTNASWGDIFVYGTNSCGDGNPSPAFSVAVNPIPDAPVVTNTGTLLESSATTGNQWYFEGILIPGATAQTYTATLNGYYWDVVTLNDCSSEPSNHVLIVVTGIDPRTSAEINIYPNPGIGMFNVSISSSSPESFRISVFDELGWKVYEETKVDVNGTLQKLIDLRPISPGVYNMIFQGTKSQLVKKIVVD